MNLYFIRHAETIYRPEDGDFNRPLSEKGVTDARRLIDEFAKVKVEKIYSSPYLRALNTIKGIAEKKELDIEIIDDLRERKAADNYIDDFQIFSTSQWEDFNYSLPGGESLKEVQKRGIKALNKIIENHHGKETNVIAGGHGT
ncbi:MAG: histidine phosphatase family protein [Halanaerobiales bacterium]